MAQIKKGVIALAGLTSRFLPASKGCPKGLVPVLDKPVIHYLVEEFMGAGINQICIIYSHGDPRIKRYFTPDANLQKALKNGNKLHLLDSLKTIQKKVEFKFIPQPRKRLPYGNGTPVLVAKSFIGQDSFVYAFGDDMVIEDKPGQYLAEMIEIFEKFRPTVVLGAQEVPWEEIHLYASIKYAQDSKYPHRVEIMTEKLPANKAHSNIAQVGRFVYSPRIIEVLASLPTSKKGSQIPELWLSDANEYLAENEIAIAQPIKNGLWITTGDPLRWLKANLALAYKNKKFKNELQQFLKTI
ncbi:UTP--glucose-1-phosphate uridylyltransferase [Patescibacteria group bacterium]